MEQGSSFDCPVARQNVSLLLVMAHVTAKLALHVETLTVLKSSCLSFNPFTAKGEFETKKAEFLKRWTKPKGVTTQMKALDEYFLMVLFVLLLKRVHFLVQTKPKGVTTQTKALEEY